MLPGLTLGCRLTAVLRASKRNASHVPAHYWHLRCNSHGNPHAHVPEPLPVPNKQQPPASTCGDSSIPVRTTFSLQDIINRELAGLELPAYTLFASNVPYADVDLWPRLGYDPEKVNTGLQYKCCTGRIRVMGAVSGCECTQSRIGWAWGASMGRCCDIVQPRAG